MEALSGWLTFLGAVGVVGVEVVELEFVSHSLPVRTYKNTLAISPGIGAWNADRLGVRATPVDIRNSLLVEPELDSLSFPRFQFGKLRHGGDQFIATGSVEGAGSLNCSRGDKPFVDDRGHHFHVVPGGVDPFLDDL